MPHLVVIAIGGNSLIKDAAHMTVYDQYKAAGETAHYIADIVARGHRVIVTHGNGPQVGFILLRSELAKDLLHEVPLDTCGADTQGAIGYQVAQTLDNELRRRGIGREVVAVVTQTVVDRDDPGFADPTKPIGPFYSRESAEEHMKNQGWAMKEDANRGWRRVVASPHPLEIVEQEAIRKLLDHGVLVVPQHLNAAHPAVGVVELARHEVGVAVEDQTLEQLSSDVEKVGRMLAQGSSLLRPGRPGKGCVILTIQEPAERLIAAFRRAKIGV